MDFAVHTVESAPETAKPLLQASRKKYTFVPNLHAVMAEAPTLLGAYQTLADLFGHTGLSVLERQIVLLAISYENGCDYCVAAHSTIATMEKMPADILQALRDGRPLADAKLEALRSFAATMAAERGWVGDAAVAHLLAHGYTRQTVLEVVLAQGFKVLSNYTNHLAHTPLDLPFQSQAWTDERPTKAAE